MPVSAYIQATAFLVVTGLALFASAGTVAILSFWIYLAIFAAITVAAFLWLDPGLLRERRRPGGKAPPLGLRLLTLMLVLHWIVAGLDRGRLHWSDSVPGWLQAASLVVFAAGCALAFWAMIVNPFFSSVVRIQTDRGPVCGDEGALRDRPAPRLCRRYPNHGVERRRAGLLARGRAVDRLQPYVPAFGERAGSLCAISVIATGDSHKTYYGISDSRGR